VLFLAVCHQEFEYEHLVDRFTKFAS